MYIYMDEDGDITQSDSLIGTGDPCSWPRVVKIEISGLDMTAKTAGLNGAWKDVKIEPAQ